MVGWRVIPRAVVLRYGGAMKLRGEITDLTVCRALFAGWVFAYHVDLHAQFSGYLGPFAGLIRHGYLGVDGFFMLSGLILARVHPELAESTSGAWRFWGRRLVRIYPVHLAVIVILAVLVATGLALGYAPRDPERFTLAGLVANLALVQGWGVGPQLAWNYPSWSVSTEWAGYLLFPALWIGLGSCRPIIPGQIMVVCFPVLGLIAYLLGGDGLNLTYATALLRFFPEFIIGMTTMRLVPINADMMPNKALAWVALAVLGLAAGLTDFDIISLLAMWLLLAALAMWDDGQQAPVFGSSRVLLGLGRLSYAFYMSFGTVELILAQVCRQQHWDPAGEKLAYSAAMTLLTLAFAVILHNLVEVPARRLGDRLLAEPAPLAPVRISL